MKKTLTFFLTFYFPLPLVTFPSSPLPLCTFLFVFQAEVHFVFQISVSVVSPKLNTRLPRLRLRGLSQAEYPSPSPWSLRSLHRSLSRRPGGCVVSSQGFASTLSRSPDGIVCLRFGFLFMVVVSIFGKRFRGLLSYYYACLISQPFPSSTKISLSHFRSSSQIAISDDLHLSWSWSPSSSTAFHILVSALLLLHRPWFR